MRVFVVCVRVCVCVCDCGMTHLTHKCITMQLQQRHPHSVEQLRDEARQHECTERCVC